MAKKGENIYHRKDGRWEGRYIKARSQSGKPIWGYIYGNKYGDVKIKLLQQKSQYGLLPTGTLKQAYQNDSFQEWCQYWLQTLVAPNIKPSSLACYERTLRLHITPALGQYRVTQIDDNLLQSYFDSLSCSASMKYNIYRLLNTIFEAAFARHVINMNPCRMLKRIKAPKRKPRYLSRTEQRKLEQILLEKQAIKELVALYTGVRLGELCAFQKDDFDPETGALQVRHSIQRVRVTKQERGKSKLFMTGLKSENAQRTVYLPPFLRGMLSAYLAEVHDAGSAFLFSGIHGRALDPRTVQRQFQKITEEAELQGVHFHTLRHSYATRCLELGMDIQTLSELLGHSTARVTLEYYSHSTDLQKKKFIDRMKPLATAI